MGDTVTVSALLGLNGELPQVIYRTHTCKKGGDMGDRWELIQVIVSSRATNMEQYM